MSLFLLAFLSIYGSVHLYAFLKVRSALSFGTGTGIILGIFMVIMTCAPIIVRILERSGYEIPARTISYIGYTWMGVLFLFFSISLLMDLYRLCAYTAGLILPFDTGRFIPPARAAFLITLISALCISLYGYFEALNIRAEKIVIRSSKIPESIGRLRIAQISDVHLGLIVRQQRLNRIIQVIREADPDILVSTGDLVDGQINELSSLARSLKEVNPRYGKYAVTGNHEFYAGLTQALEITRNAGFHVLRGESVKISDLISIAGVDDPTGKRFGLSKGASEEELLSGLDGDTFTLLLKHIPVVRNNTHATFDLQLSGHTHRGQIFPFRLIIGLFFSHVAGLYDLYDGAHLYVSGGTGTWGPPIRFLSPPEVTVIDIIHDKNP